MFQLKQFEFKASEIASLVKKDMIGEDIVVRGVKQLTHVVDGAMAVCYPTFKDRLHAIEARCLIFCTRGTVIQNPHLTFIVTDNPKLTFFQFIHDQLVTETSYWCEAIVSEKSEKYPGVAFGYNVKIGRNVVIAPNAVIGSNCIIGTNVVIRANVEIGNNCVVKDNTIVGSEGFGFMNSEEGLLHIPQIGGIRIGDNVVIGSNCTIEKPALGFTTIGDNVKIDDLVQIGHNHEIGRNTIITTGFKAEGSVKIGSDSFIGMGVTVVSKKVTIGNHCLIGAGTVLTKSVPDNKVVFSRQVLVVEDVEDKLENILSTKKK